MVYLDNAATTPLNAAAISAMTVKHVRKWPNSSTFLPASLSSLLVGLRATIQQSKVTPSPIKLRGNI